MDGRPMPRCRGVCSDMLVRASEAAKSSIISAAGWPCVEKEENRREIPACGMLLSMSDLVDVSRGNNRLYLGKYADWAAMAI